MDLVPLMHPELARARTVDDPDVVQEVFERLTAAGWSGAAAWRQEREIVEAEGKAPELQRFLIARNLNAKFCGVGVDTRTERIVLNAQGPLAEFLSHIETYVVPSLMRLYPTMH